MILWNHVLYKLLKEDIEAAAIKRAHIPHRIPANMSKNHFASVDLISCSPSYTSTILMLGKHLHFGPLAFPYYIQHGCSIYSWYYINTARYNSGMNNNKTYEVLFLACWYGIPVLWIISLLYYFRKIMKIFIQTCTLLCHH